MLRAATASGNDAQPTNARKNASARFAPRGSLLKTMSDRAFIALPTFSARAPRANARCPMVCAD
jgi:hypothetical protein